MALSREEVLRIVYPENDAVRGRRFTQDSPILLDVWDVYAQRLHSDKKSDRHLAPHMLLTPHADHGVAKLVRFLRWRLAILRAHVLDTQPPPEDDALSDDMPASDPGTEDWKVELEGVVFNESHAVAPLTYRELLCTALPLSGWGAMVLRELQSVSAPGKSIKESLLALKERSDIGDLLMEPSRWDPDRQYPADLLNFLRIASGIAYGQILPSCDAPSEQKNDYFRAAIDSLIPHLEDAYIPPRPEDETRTLSEQGPLFGVCCNRAAHSAVYRSRLAVKADAAVQLFNISCKYLRWAVLDSGIQADHPAFVNGYQKGELVANLKKSRVTRTYDFTRLRTLMESGFEDVDKSTDFEKIKNPEAIRRDLQKRLRIGRPLDWALLEPLIRIRHDDGYAQPKNEHGTHVAGILAGNWKDKPNQPLIGMCPDIEVFDLRVISPDGTGEEFTLLAALQFVRWLNENKDEMVVHGVNLSFSLPHAVDTFACGSTPICEECTRLVANKVVVVTAAGNRGYRNTVPGGFEDYKNICITDPGNAEDVITVGATHRFMPHKYGVSYFSSRGPTGDGRPKPDLVAPGEKIESTAPGGRSLVLDGTSMAAPHVSGAAALLMGRHRELIGKPARIKQILCSTATDLGREKSFQGAGMLDVLRAIQSV